MRSNTIISSLTAASPHPVKGLAKVTDVMKPRMFPAIECVNSISPAGMVLYRILWCLCMEENESQKSRTGVLPARQGQGSEGETA